MPNVEESHCVDLLIALQFLKRVYQRLNGRFYEARSDLLPFLQLINILIRDESLRCANFTLVLQMRHVIVLVLATLGSFLGTTHACSCMPAHPQEHFCNSDFGKAPSPILHTKLIKFLRSDPRHRQKGIPNRQLRQVLQGQDSKGVQNVRQGQNRAQARPDPDVHPRQPLRRQPGAPQDLRPHREGLRAEALHKPLRVQQAVVDGQPQAEEGVQAPLRPGMRLQVADAPMQATIMPQQDRRLRLDLVAMPKGLRNLHEEPEWQVQVDKEPGHEAVPVRGRPWKVLPEIDVNEATRSIPSAERRRTNHKVSILPKRFSSKPCNFRSGEGIKTF